MKDPDVANSKTGNKRFLFQVRLPGAAPQCYLLSGSTRTTPGLLPLPGVSAGGTKVQLKLS